MFVAPVGDHYRTRLTHTLEVSAVARTTARALALNEDLVEAIAMGHDLGHAPFGHAGEAALDEILRAEHDRRFEHNVQSLRVVQVLERGGRGLNLTDAVRDGILHHTGPRAPGDAGGADRAAAGPGGLREPRHRGRPAGRRDPGGRPAGRRGGHPRPDDVGAAHHPRRGRGRRERRGGADPPVGEVGAAFLRLRRFMFQRVYLAPPASLEAERARGVVRSLFRWYLEHPEMLPASEEPDPVTRVTDFVAGMTDRYALRTYRDIFEPKEGPL